ncbi:hypothetical protein [Roseovarius dicentrarchi]|uniref:hypothetical protein n=1 Tax=Roseovarius dicentrarchi TaxID=2250573 RepID=UPI000DE8FAAC|nr:hypothetical protein [Roseovarius dicentrarchi]
MTGVKKIGMGHMQDGLAPAITVDKCQKSAFIYSDSANLRRDVKMFVKPTYVGRLFDKLR